MKYLIIPAILCLITFLGSVAIYRKAGYPWWLGLFAPAVGVMAFMFFQLAAIPVTVLIMFPHLAFANWPVIRKAEDGMVWGGLPPRNRSFPSWDGQGSSPGRRTLPPGRRCAGSSWRSTPARPRPATRRSSWARSWPARRDGGGATPSRPAKFA